MTTHSISGRILLVLTMHACGTSAGEDAGGPDAAAAPPPAQSSADTVISGVETSDTSESASDPARDASGTAGEWTAQDTRVARESAGVSVLRAVRTARHDGFDRIVLDFGDAAVPGYGISYIDRPVRQCGSGHSVPLAGDGWLEIEATPANAHSEAGESTVSDRSRKPALPNLRELEMTCDFEAHVVWVAGLSSPTPYRVFELRQPSRLVVDIRHSGGS